MICVPFFIRNTQGQLTYAGTRPATDEQVARMTAWRTDQLSIDIIRSRADAQKHSDERGFKEQQRMLRDKAWRPDYKRPQGDGLRPFTNKPMFTRRRGQIEQAAA